MPRRDLIRRVLVIGSGPIIIGQAAEFDYAGTQACKSLREEGIEVILVNSNPATIMTDLNIADQVYLEPLTPHFLSKIIARERPDGLLPTLGGQTGLNLAFNLSRLGVLEEHGVKLLGTPLSAIEKAEDREKFKETMQAIQEPVPESRIVGSVTEAREFAREIGFPIIVRPAYTLGGTGGGIVGDEDELVEIVTKGLLNSIIQQVLLERSVAGWKEIEYEVMRDGADNCITVCNMENFDPIGIHTGDSIVVAPSQTLSDKEYQMLRSASIKIIRALGIEGGCNIQFALDPAGMDYYVIEVNPRVSRSSALASKATGYPIAKVAAKIAIGLRLDEIKNAVTGKTTACFEPALDYVVVKIPRWPFDKFALANRALGTQMKATGEVMAIDRSFEGALQKAVRSLETGLSSLEQKHGKYRSEAELLRRVKTADDERLFVMVEALRHGIEVDDLVSCTRVDRFFVEKLKNIVEMERRATELSGLRSVEADSPIPPGMAELLKSAKKLGLSDHHLAALAGVPEERIRHLRAENLIRPVYKIVDTCAAEFEAITPYYYSAYETEDELATSSKRQKVVVIGSGPIRIGQGIEFDYCSVHSVWALKEAGFESIIINNNPETVSTDFDTSDRLYFEPLTEEDVLNIVEREKPLGVVVQFGGQTAINLAGPLHEAGIRILGTAVRSIDLAEDRDKFGKLISRLGIPQAEGQAATSVEEAMGIALKIGFPLLVRPSYVLGGRAMEIVHDETELLEYVKCAAEVSPRYPVLVDRYIPGREVEVDAISDGERTLIPGIMEHIERAGVHSGDSTAVFPPQNLSRREVDLVVDYTRTLAAALQLRGIMNVQYVVHGGKVYVLEVNPRASRTVPFISKVTGVPMVALATRIMLGQSLAQLGYPDGLLKPPPFVTVKAPVFSFEKLGAVETSLGPEMKSTGEVLGLDEDYSKALYKAIVAAGGIVPLEGRVLVTIADKDKEEAYDLLACFHRLGFKFFATNGTAAFLESARIPSERVRKIGEGNPNVIDLIKEGKVDLVLNTPTRGKIPERSGFKLRRAAVEFRVPCLTSLDTTRAVLEVIKARKAGQDVEPRPLSAYLQLSGVEPNLRKKVMG